MPRQFLCCLLFLASAAWWLSRAPAPVSIATRQAKLPVYFIENQGQVDSRVAYHVQGRHSAAYFTRTSVFYSLSERKLAREASLQASRQAWVRLEFLDANPEPVMEPVQRTEAVVSYFRGPRDQWKTGLPTYSGVTYHDLWPGIDLEFGGPDGLLKYTFHVRPGADPRQIRFAYRGATSVTLAASGSLHIETPAGGFSDEKPVAWQDAPQGRRPVSAAFRLDGEEVRFDVGPYDPTLPLTLDPVVLLYAGYLGGFPGGESGAGIAVDAAGNTYVTGVTSSSQDTFPVTGGPDVTHNGGQDAFVAKVNAAGTALVYAGYIGGSNDESGSGIAVDAAGNAYVTGVTNSSQDTFPVTGGPDVTHNGGQDAFVVKVNAAGTALVYAGYVGGSGSDTGAGIAVDAAGNVYVTGSTSSTDGTFPVASGPDVTHNGSSFGDAFVAKVNTAGTALVYAGFLGGSGLDVGKSIAVDAAGNAYVAGYTESSDFPVSGGLDLTYNGSFDAFVAKVNAAGSALIYAGYIGGTSGDYGTGIAVDAAGNAYITGQTASGDFPVTGGPDLTYNGGQDAFVAKVNAAGTALVYAGYIGGTGEDYGMGIAVDAAGNAYITGHTGFTQATFPVTGGPDLTYNGSFDAFVAKVNAAGTSIVYAGYIGGSNVETGQGIAVDVAGNAYVTGHTVSGDFPVSGGPDLTFNGMSDAFVAKVSAFSSTAGPVLAFRNGFNAIETNTFPSPGLRNSGGNFRLNPVVSLSASGRAFLAGRDSVAGVWVNVLRPDETYSGWVFAGGNSPGQPALAVAGETAWIAIRDPWNAYSVRSYNQTTGFGSWTWLQGFLATDPQIAACPNGDVYVTGRDHGNGVWTRRYNATLAAWQAWHFIGGVIADSPAIACGSDNAAYVAVRDFSNNMWLARVAQEAQAEWNYGEGLFQGDLQVAAHGNRIHVAGLSSGVPWYRTWEIGSGWHGWTSPGGVLSHFAVATYGGNLFIAGQDGSGKVWWWSGLSNSWTNFGGKNVAPGSGFSAGAR